MKEKWTSDLREIERRMVRAGLISQRLVWDENDITNQMNIKPVKKKKGRRQTGKPPVKT